VRFLCFQRGKYKSGEPGERYITPIVKTKGRKYGPVIETQVLGRKRSILVTGAHDSGKTRILERLHAEERSIWNKSTDHRAIYLGALRPLGAWSDCEHVRDWWEARAAKVSDSEAGTAKESETRPWSKLPPWERAEKLPLYLSETGAVLFLDDAHKLAGRKLQIARACVLAARVWVVAASSEARLPPNLRQVILRCDPQLVRLDSDVAYDATNLLTWALVCALLAAGLWEASLVVAGLKTIAGSRQAAKQDA